MLEIIQPARRRGKVAEEWTEMRVGNNNFRLTSSSMHQRKTSTEDAGKSCTVVRRGSGSRPEAAHGKSISHRTTQIRRASVSCFSYIFLSSVNECCFSRLPCSSPSHSHILLDIVAASLLACKSASLGQLRLIETRHLIRSKLSTPPSRHRVRIA